MSKKRPFRDEVICGQPLTENCHISQILVNFYQHIYHLNHILIKLSLLDLVIPFPLISECEVKISTSYDRLLTALSFHHFYIPSYIESVGMNNSFDKMRVLAIG